MTVHINKSAIANILYFVEVFDIAVVHIMMDTSMEKVINVHIKYLWIIHLKACAEGLLYTNLDEPNMIANPTNVSVNA